MTTNKKVNLKYLQDHFFAININLKSNNIKFDNVNLKKTMFEELNKNSKRIVKENTSKRSADAKNEELIKKVKKLTEQITKRLEITQKKIDDFSNPSGSSMSRMSVDEYAYWDGEDNDRDKIMTSYKPLLEKMRNEDGKNMWLLMKYIMETENTDGLDNHYLVNDILIDMLIKNEKVIELKEQIFQSLNEEKIKKVIINLLEWIILKSPPSRLSISSNRPGSEVITTFRNIGSPGIIALLTLQNANIKFNEFIDKNTSSDDYRYLNMQQLNICGKTYDKEDIFLIPKFVELSDELINDVFPKDDGSELGDEDIISILFNSYNILEIIKEQRDKYKTIDSLLLNLSTKTEMKGGADEDDDNELSEEEKKLLNKLLKNINDSLVKVKKKRDSDLKNSRLDQRLDKSVLSKIKDIQQTIVINNINYLIDKIFNTKNKENKLFYISSSSKKFKIDNFTIDYNLNKIQDDVNNDKWITELYNYKENFQVSTLTDDLLQLCKKPEVNTLIESPEVFLVIYPSDCPPSEIKKNNCEMNKIKMKIYSSFLFKGSDYGENVNEIESKLNILVIQELRKRGFDSCGEKGNKKDDAKDSKQEKTSDFTSNKTRKNKITSNNKTLKK